MFNISLPNGNFSCLEDLAKLKEFELTSSRIWNATSEYFYEFVSECNYNGCIHELICSQTCGDDLCDEGLFAIYSGTGMTCGNVCEYLEFNLSHSKYQCKDVPCTTNKIIINESHACLANLTALVDSNVTNILIWN